MDKELLTIKFEYRSVPAWETDNGYREKKIAIGIFDTLDEAIEAGNKVIMTLSELLGVDDGDCFSKNGLFGGFPVRVVGNHFYRPKKVFYRAEITHLAFDDLHDTIKEVVEEREKYDAFVREQVREKDNN